MHYRTDPKTGNKLSILGFGCMRFGGSDLVNSFSGLFDRNKAEELIVRAAEAGINYFDTAYIYPGSEEILGKTLEKHNLRDKVYIATKLPLIMLKKKDDFDKYFYKELKRLLTSHIDYYLLHMLSSPEDWDKLCGWGIKEWIKEKKESGQIKQIGFSFHGSCDDFLTLLDVYSWDFVQIQFNYSDENFQAGITGLNKAFEKSIPVMIMEPLLGGKLANNLPQEAKDIFNKITPDQSCADWGLKWVWNHPQVTVVLSGMNEFDQLEDNVKSANSAEANMLTSEEMDAYSKVKEIFAKSYKVHCTACRYCTPCPAGVDIPSCFSAYNTYYSVSKNTGFFQYVMSTLLSQTPSYAGKCKKCGKCEKHCPQHIEIRNELDNVSATMEGLRFKIVALFMKFYRKIRG